MAINYLAKKLINQQNSGSVTPRTTPSEFNYYPLSLSFKRYDAKTWLKMRSCCCCCCIITNLSQNHLINIITALIGLPIGSCSLAGNNNTFYLAVSLFIGSMWRLCRPVGSHLLLSSHLLFLYVFLRNVLCTRSLP